MRKGTGAGWTTGAGHTGTGRTNAARAGPGRRAAWPAGVALLVVLTLLVSGPARALSSYDPFPTGTLGVSRPVIGQRFVLDPGDKYSSAEMWLDGRRVTPSWDPATRYVTYRPGEPLAPGKHHVKLVVRFEPARAGWYYSPVVGEYDFTVAPDALASLPAPDPEARFAAQYLNTFRVAAGLPPVTADPALTMAAARHAAYVAEAKDRDAHVEKPVTPLYTAAEPWDRARYYGYWQDWGVGEVVAYEGPAEAAIDAWLATLYHRIPLVNPGNTEIGFGHAGGERLAEVIDAGPGAGAAAEATSVPWPYRGMTNVPTSWSGAESPDPFRLYPGVSGPVGYTVSLTFSPRPDRLELGSADLAGPGGAEVAVMTFSPGNDDKLADTVAMIPRAPLEPETAYTARLTGTVTYGSVARPFDETWSFTTGPSGFESGKGGWSYTTTQSGDLVRFAFGGLRLPDDVEVFLNGLPARELERQSRSELSLRLPVGFEGGATSQVLMVSAGAGRELTCAANGLASAGGTAGEALAAVSAPFPPGAKSQVPALRHADGTVMVPESALEGLGAVPFRLPEIRRTYWTLAGHAGSVTLGSTVAWVDGARLRLPLPVREEGGETYVPAEFAVALLDAASRFADVEGHWAAEAITRLAKLAIVSGPGDGTFRPEAKLTRAAFVKMLVKAAGLAPEPGEGGGFTDTAAHWVAAQGYLGPAVEAGIVRPEEYPGALFEPERNITREEIAVMVVRAMGLDAEASRREVVPDSGGRVSVAGQIFADADTWGRRGHVAVAIEQDIVEGYEVAGGVFVFHPEGPATRAEAATMVARMLDRAGTAGGG